MDELLGRMRARAAAGLMVTATMRSYEEDPVRRADLRTSMCDYRVALSLTLDHIDNIDRNGWRQGQ